MNYATQQDLIDRFGEQELIQLTDRATPPAGAIDATVLGKALADADDEIDSYVATRYTLPFSTAPKILRRIACDIARYRLFEDRVTDQVRQRYTDAVKFLQSVASGDVTLGVDDAGAMPDETSGPDYSANDRVFSQSTLSDYVG